MGQHFSSEPKVEKDTERDHDDIFNVAVSSCQGWRMSQEDNHTMMLELPGNHKAAFFAVYDGHGGARVSKHASEGLWRHLIENEMYIKGNFKEALEGAFLTFDKEVNESYNAQLAGTTAVCVLIVDNVIYCANIGDSRAVASINCECVPLSYDHKPENPLELKRILAAGGYVLGNRVNGNLALSRAFGDFHYKGNEALAPEHQIVSPCPDIKVIELNDDVDFVLLACDGIWDVLTSDDAIEFVITRLEHSMEPGLICEELTTRCLATDYELVIGCDNMTVLLICYTRGRSWADYCTDIFNKNTAKLGVPRTRPKEEDFVLGLAPRIDHDAKLSELINTLKNRNITTGSLDECSTSDNDNMRAAESKQEDDPALLSDSVAVPENPSKPSEPSSDQKEGEVEQKQTEDKQPGSQKEKEKQVVESVEVNETESACKLERNQELTDQKNEDTKVEAVASNEDSPPMSEPKLESQDPTPTNIDSNNGSSNGGSSGSSSSSSGSGSSSCCCSSEIGAQL